MLLQKKLNLVDMVEKVIGGYVQHTFIWLMILKDFIVICL